ncbi:MAG: tyrosine-type recombinase/integrase [Ferruginibacter sp.]
MSVTLRKRKNADGTTSLRLDIYHNGKHRIETLKHLQLAKPSSLLDRENNKALLKQAEAIKLNRAVELEGRNYDIKSDAGKKTEVVVWMQNYIDDYTKRDKRNMEGALKRFIKFLSETKNTGLTFGTLHPILIERFIDFLQERSVGEGARSYYARFKKMIKHAYRMNMMPENVLDKVEKKAVGEARKKDILTLDELKILANTPINSQEVKHAALFSSVTGLAWADISNLTWDKINLDTRRLVFVREKLKRKNKTVSVHLNDIAMKILEQADKSKHLIFQLPTADGANKTLGAWVTRAGLNQHIRWHNLRHSFGTNLILCDVDIFKTSKSMGHGSVNQTTRYVIAAAEVKDRSTDKLHFDFN